MSPSYSRPESGESPRFLANRFRIDTSANSGGMGTIYRAFDEHTGEYVAVKLLHSATMPDANERFLREGRVLGELQHPAIVRYVAHGISAQGQPYLAMEWLEGEDLAQRLCRSPLKPG